MSWYDDLREQYIPDQLKVVFLGESPPDPGTGRRRFFYSSELTGHDNLFRGIMHALYDADKHAVRGRKEYWLRRFSDDGCWLMDAASYPINMMSKSKKNAILRENAGALSQRLVHLNPDVGVIVCHCRVFSATASTLLSAGVPLLHNAPIPFPLGNQRSRFVRLTRVALVNAGFPVGA